MASFEASRESGDPYPDPKGSFGVLENAWARKLTADGRIYFSNRATGASQWHIPNDFYEPRCLGVSGARAAGDDVVAMPGTARAVLNVDCMTEFAYDPAALGAETVAKSQQMSGVTQLPADPVSTELPSATLGPDETSERVRLTIVSARGLRDADFMPGPDKSDPFVSIEIMGRPGWLVRTETIKNCLDPVWDHTCELGGLAATDILVFTVWDYDSYKNQEVDTPLGKTLLAIDDLKTPGTMELRLDDAGPGIEAYLTLRVEG
jgi:hypothetical protein